MSIIISVMTMIIAITVITRVIMWLKTHTGNDENESNSNDHRHHHDVNRSNHSAVQHSLGTCYDSHCLTVRIHYFHCRNFAGAVYMMMFC